MIAVETFLLQLNTFGEALFWFIRRFHFAFMMVCLLNNILVPRTFKLYEELEKAEKGHLTDQNVTYGLDKGDDKSFTQWNGTIIGPVNTNFDNRIYFLTLRCNDDYPVKPPQISFLSKVNLPSVNPSNGKVEPRFSGFQHWTPDKGMEQMLIGLKNEMIANKKLPQPQDGDMYA